MLICMKAHNVLLQSHPLVSQANGAADSCSAPHLALYVAELARYGRPVWLTELACPLGPGAGNEAAQAAYMAAALDVLDRECAVERRAQHLPFAPALVDITLIAVLSVVCYAVSRLPSCPMCAGLRPRFVAAPQALQAQTLHACQHSCCSMPHACNNISFWAFGELLQGWCPLPFCALHVRMHLAQVC